MPNQLQDSNSLHSASAVKSMGEIRRIPIKAPTLVPVALSSVEPQANSSALSQLYMRQVSRKEFIVASAGIAVAGLGLKSMLERKLNQKMPSPFTSQSSGFGGGPYGA